MRDGDLEQAREELAALVAEEVELAETLAEAAEDADGEEVLRLRDREARLPAEVWEARVRVERLRIEDLKARHAAALAALHQAERDRVPVEQAYWEAEERVLAARQAERDAHGVVTTIEAQISEQEQRLENLLRVPAPRLS